MLKFAMQQEEFIVDQGQIPVINIFTVSQNALTGLFPSEPRPGGSVVSVSDS